MRKEITFDRFVRGALGTAGVALAIYIINLLSDVLLPFFIGWVFAYMLYPLVKFFQYTLRLRSRVISIILAGIVVLAVLTGIFWLVIPPIISETIRFKDVTLEFISTRWGDSVITEQITLFFQTHVDQNSILQLLHEKNIVEAAKSAVSQAMAVVYKTVDIVIGVIASLITLLYMFFILLDYEKLSNGWIKLVPKKNRRFAGRLAHDVEHGMNAYFRGQALVAFLVGVLFSIGFLIIDFPMAIGLGLFIGLLNLVPYLQVIGFIPTILLALIKAADTGENFWLILFLTCIVFIVVQTIQDMILVPKIMGKLMGLNPAIILLSLSVWGSLLGIIGLIIALPLTTLILSYYKQYIDYNEKQWQKRHRNLTQKADEEKKSQKSEE